MDKNVAVPWHTAVEQLAPHVVKLSTPRGHGTGFLFAYPTGGNLCAIATARHVLQDADEWHEPIRVEQPGWTHSIFLNSADRAIFQRGERDTAALIFRMPAGTFPEQPIPLAGENAGLKVGVEIGWVGFPGVAPTNLCFFCGSISSRIETERDYLVDGVAIHGVSGGPAFWAPSDAPLQIIGVVSEYWSDMAGRVPLPGLAVIKHVDALHEIVRTFKSLDEAKGQDQK